MSAVRMVRKRANALPWLRAVVFFVAALTAFAALPFYPAAARPLLAIVCGALGLFAPAIGVLALVVALALPLAAGNFLVGALFLLVGLASVGYLGQGGARAFVVVALAFVACLAHAEWALAPLAGYILGATDGAFAAAVAVVLIEVAGLALGNTSTGVLATGGAHALVSTKEIAALGDKALSFAWLAPAVAKLDVDAALKTLAGTHDVPLLVLQPVLWGAAAGLTGSLTRHDRQLRSLAVVAGSTLLLAAASIGAITLLHGPVAGPVLGATVPFSLAAALAAGAIAAWVFPLEPVPDEGKLPSLRAEDADVDELLRMIANAEEALEDRHAADRVVLITDMKGFSRMTQEQGTLSTAKAIQKHRDLLLPVILECGGHGKSTGGDGLVAAFASADEALKAAVLMQRTLKDYNRKKPEAQIFVRMGLAAGDVIVDRAGCPFIGDALNLAARVMGLADGGQVFAASDVVDSAAELPSPVVSHGGFALKNIAQPVSVYEVLWDEGQQPKRPEAEPSAA